MLKLKSLTISDVGRFVGKHTVSFEGRSSFLQLDGNNKNTGGSSGASKSTVFNSLDYLLGVNEVFTTVLQSRLTKSPMEVSGEFQDGDRAITITRGKSSGLSVKVNGVEIAGGDVKAAELELEKLIKVPKEYLRKTYHKRQKEGGFFLGLGPKKSHEFLADVLDLKPWIEKLEKADIDHSNLKKKKEFLEESKRSAESLLSSLTSSFSVLTRPVLSFEPAYLQVLEKGLETSKKALATIRSAAELSMAHLDNEIPVSLTSPDSSSLDLAKKSLTEAEAVDRADKQALMNKVSELSLKLRELESSRDLILSKKASLPSLSQELEVLKKDILTIRSGKCPTCDQSWDKSHGSLDQKINKAKSIAIRSQEIEALDAGPIQSEIVSLGLELSHVKTQVSAQSSEVLLLKSKVEKEQSLFLDQNNKISLAREESLRAIQAKKNKIREDLARDSSQYEFDISEKTQLVTKLKAELSFFIQAEASFKSNTEKLSLSIEDAKKNLAKIDIDLSHVSRMVIVSAEASKTIRAYMGTMFHGALDSIAEKATKILSRVPNMATSTIYFEGFKETKTGAIKEEISAVITMDGEVGIPISSMSGGERTAIDLAVDLAVIDIIEERVGKGLDIFILDEPFDGVDSICREQCLELLKAHASDRRIVLVDHSNETKEMVEDRIVVTREGVYSSFKD